MASAPRPDQHASLPAAPSAGRLRIAIQTWGSAGDVRPAIALGAGLVARGHQVRLAATAVDSVDYRDACARVGVAYEPVPERLDYDLSRLVARVGPTPEPLRLLEVLFDELLFPLAPAMQAASRRLCAWADVAVGHALCHTLRAEAQAAGTPWASLAFWPGMVPSDQWPPYPLPPLGRWGNRAAWALARRIIDRIYLGRARGAWRVLGLPLPRDSFDDVWFSPRLSLLAASPALTGAPDMGAHHVCGAFTWPESAEEPLPDAVARFLDEGPPPLYFTLGSPQKVDPSRAVERFLGAARRVGRRALINASTPGHPPLTRDGDCLFVGPLPHRAVMPRCALVVHHGGAGTTHAAARAGVPAVVLGLLDEQMAWGTLLRRRGVAPSPLRWSRASPRAIAARVESALADPRMAERAHMLADAMRHEDGVAEAARLIAGLRR